MSKVKNPLMTCHMCRCRIDDEDRFCFGCKTYMCESCAVNLCTGKHVPIDHVRQVPGEYHGS